MVGLFGGHRQLSMDSCYGAVRMLLSRAHLLARRSQGRVAILRPVFSDGLLGFTKRHLPCFDQGCEIAFDLVLLFEVDLQSCASTGPHWGQILSSESAPPSSGAPDGPVHKWPGLAPRRSGIDLRLSESEVRQLLTHAA